MDNNNQQAEYATGVWAREGQEVRFKCMFGGHVFTEQEVADLLADKQVEFMAVSSRTGKEYKACGRLERKTYNGHEYVGFSPDFGSRVPDEMCGHKFTAGEKADLEAGKEIHCTDLVSKKSGRTYDAYLSWGAKSDGTKGIVFRFPDKKK